MFASVLDRQAAPNLEPRQDLVACLHGEAVNEGLCDRLSDRSGSVESDVSKLVTQDFDLGDGGQRRARVGRHLGEFCLAGTKGLCLVGEVADAFGEHVGGESAGLEGVHVALEGGFGLGQFGVGGCQLVVVSADRQVGGGLVGQNGAGDELRVAVKIDER
ncbi:MAG: hypothetical protein ABSC31_06175 [Acidimicrobiales bacterium]